MKRTRFIPLLFVVALAVIGLCMRPPGADASPNENEAAEEPTIVGRMVCMECHRENYELHARSGHAHTLSDASDPKVAEQFAGKSFESGLPWGTYHYFSEEGQLRVRREGPGASEESVPLQFALGSGEHGYTLLTLLRDAAGETIGLEHRGSWFRSKTDLQLTPGHDELKPQAGISLYGDPLKGERLEECIDCHSTRGTIVGQTVVDHIPNVNCEKCHGAGSEHVRQARLSDTPPPYSVGKVQWDAEAEIQLCGSCHRLPVHFNPKQLREYGESLIRFQPIGLVRSECYLEADGQLSCTTCHNPHMSIAEKSRADYVQDCIDCHQENEPDHTTCPVSTTEGCIDCHMPLTEFNGGIINFHDHWIRVVEDGTR